MTELSPQAQAVKDAVIALYSDQQQIRDWGWRLDAPTVAAALRAAADQVLLMRPHGGRAWTVEQAAAYDALTKASDLLNAIAAELEGGND
jgi:hypothetical protein